MKLSTAENLTQRAIGEPSLISVEARLSSAPSTIAPKSTLRLKVIQKPNESCHTHTPLHEFLCRKSLRKSLPWETAAVMSTAQPQVQGEPSDLKTAYARG